MASLYFDDEARQDLLDAFTYWCIIFDTNDTTSFRKQIELAITRVSQFPEIYEVRTSKRGLRYRSFAVWNFTFSYQFDAEKDIVRIFQIVHSASDYR